MLVLFLREVGKKQTRPQVNGTRNDLKMTFWGPMETGWCSVASQTNYTSAWLNQLSKMENNSEWEGEERRVVEKRDSVYGSRND